MIVCCVRSDGLDVDVHSLIVLYAITRLLCCELAVCENLCTSFAAAMWVSAMMGSKEQSGFTIVSSMR